MLQKGRLKVLFASAEVSPYAKTGGLADVAGSLPKVLAAMGNDVVVVMPGYKNINHDMEYVTDFSVQLGNKKQACIIRKTKQRIDETYKDKKPGVYFIDNCFYYDRDSLYCHLDDGERFAFFCVSILEMLPKIDFRPDVIHCNDWHTGPVCMLLKEKYIKDPFYKDITTLYTIHNLKYQGNFPSDVLQFFNVGGDVFTPEKVEFYGTFSFMKAGIVYADIVNTVSSVYAEEIQTHQYGEGMEGLLRKRSEDLYGIVNGVSYEQFNPETDPNIYQNYSAATIEDKKNNKYGLQREMNLPIRDIPVIGLISRLSEQKGLDLVINGIDRIMQHDMQFILLGTGDPYYENTFRNLKNKYPHKIGVYIGFNETLARKIYAGSDMFLMPSRFEPCGLGQLISLRYGTIPIVRAVGGLAETIVDYWEDNENGNGFSFNEYSFEEMAEAIQKAVILYNEKPHVWRQLVNRAMCCDFSWDRSAQKYMDLYCLMLEKRSRQGQGDGVYDKAG